MNAMQGRLEKHSRLDGTTYHKMPGCYYLQWWSPLRVSQDICRSKLQFAKW